MVSLVGFSIFRHATNVFGRLALTLSAGLASLPALAESGTYVPYSGIIHGTEGADPVAVTIANATGGALVCGVALAHWYSAELGGVAPGVRLAVTLWHDSETGVLNLMNATDDRMPVEALWCARGAARARLDLPMTTGKAEAEMLFTCRMDGDAGLSCTEAGG